MKILYYSPHPYLNLASPSGPGTHMREVIGAFREQGHEVSVCILGGEHLYVDSRSFVYSNSGIKKAIKSLIPELLWQTVKDLNLQRKDNYAKECLDMVIQEFQPDLIYERGFYMMTSGVELAATYEIPHILEMNAPFLEEKIEMEGKTLARSIARKKEKIQAEGTNLMVVVSSTLKDYYEAEYHSLKDRILITPNAIDLKNFETDPDDVAKFRSSLGFNENDLVIGFVGSIFPYHGVQFLLDAFIQFCANNNRNDIRLLIVGDGETLPELKEKALNSEHSSQITFTGNVPYEKVRNYIANMDITILANSKSYCSPIKIFEYGAMGKAVISINTQAVRDVMKNRVDGILIDNPESDLYPAIEELVTDAALRNSMAENFQQKVLKNYTWIATGESILSTFGQQNEVIDVK